MSVVDLHPEELLDKDARGELTDDERARLDAHLDRCAACRAEVVLRADFADELDGFDDAGAAERPSRASAPAERLLDLVQGALAAPRAEALIAPPEKRAEGVAPSPSPAPAPISAPITADMIPGLRRRPRRTAVVLLVAAALVAGSAAGATGLTGRIWLGLRGNSQEVTHVTGGAMPKAAAPASNGASAAERTAGGAVAPSAALTEANDPTPVSEPIAPALPAPTAIVDAPATPTRTLAVTVATARASAPAVPAVPAVAAAPGAPVVSAVLVAPAPAPVPTTAAALFDSANAARHDGDTAAALARYDALEKQFPQTTEARLAKATTGKLLLDRGDAAGALARFDAYLASGANELREEAMAGRATALERLGRSDDEVRAWAALLAAYPGTPYAVHAKTRVARSLGR